MTGTLQTIGLVAPCAFLRIHFHGTNDVRVAARGHSYKVLMGFAGARRWPRMVTTIAPDSRVGPRILGAESTRERNRGSIGDLSFLPSTFLPRHFAIQGTCGPARPWTTQRNQENFAWDKRGQRSKGSAWNDAASQEVTVLNHLLDRARL